MKFFERRRHQAQLMVIAALLGQDELNGLEIAQRTGLNIARTHLTLAVLEEAQRIKSQWQDGPYPRRRLYRLAEGGRVSPEDMQRFEVEPQEWRGDRSITLHCTRCNAWTAVVDGPLTLAELVQRAEEHTEVCR